MGNNNTHARRLLLQKYEKTTMELEHCNAEIIPYLSGKLQALAEILQECRHNGDGKDPIKHVQWQHHAAEQVRDAFQRTGGHT